jgi:hypothetical protein
MNTLRGGNHSGGAEAVAYPVRVIDTGATWRRSTTRWHEKVDADLSGDKLPRSNALNGAIRQVEMNS